MTDEVRIEVAEAIPHPLTRLTAEKKALFLEALSEMPNVARACRIIGLSRTKMYEYRQEDPAFAKAWEDAIEEGVDSLEEAAFERAKRISDTLTIFLLKAYRPEKFMDRHDLTSAGQPLSAGIQLVEVVVPAEATVTVMEEVPPVPGLEVK